MNNDWWSRRLSSNPTTQPTQRTFVPSTTPAIKFPTPTQTQQKQTPETMGEAIRVWQGGEAARKEGSARCPECGSRHVFSRVGSGTTINGSQPAPRCFECGWNGKYNQGDQANWAV